MGNKKGRVATLPGSSEAARPRGYWTLQPCQYTEPSRRTRRKLHQQCLRQDFSPPLGGREGACDASLDWGSPPCRSLRRWSSPCLCSPPAPRTGIQEACKPLPCRKSTDNGHISLVGQGIEGYLSLAGFPPGAAFENPWGRLRLHGFCVVPAWPSPPLRRTPAAP